MTDLSGDAYVKEHFAHRPDIMDTFLALPFPILKADFLRYLLLFNEGGIYFDLDVSCEGPPIHDWVPEQYKKDAGLVVGWEFDVCWWTALCASLRHGRSWRSRGRRTYR